MLLKAEEMNYPQKKTINLSRMLKNTFQSKILSDYFFTYNGRQTFVARNWITFEKLIFFNS